MTIPKISRRIVDFFGLQKNIVALLGMVILVGLGEKMAERFLPLYLLALGGGAFSIGLLNGLDNLLSALYSLPGGYASDKLGHKRALLLFNLIAMAGFLIVIFFPYWQAVILGAILFISWTAISLPATMDMVATVLPKNKRTMGVSLHSFVRRVPMALGPLIGGALIGAYGETRGIRIAFIVALALAAVSLLLQQIMFDDTRPSSESKKNGNHYGIVVAQSGFAKTAGFGYPGAFLRANPLCLRGRLVRHPQQNYPAAVWHLDHRGDGHGHAGLYPGGLPGG